MAQILRKIFGFRKKKVTKKDSITGRNNSFPVPYLSKLEGNQLQPGQSLIVRGIIVGKNEFVINLTSGPRVEFDEDTDVLDNRLLCLRVGLETSRKIRINACVNGEWGREGTVSWEGRTYTVPYAADIPGNFYPSRKLYVSGLSKKRSKSFNLELHSGSNIALRINPRFPSKKIIFNTRVDNVWGEEERPAMEEFPLRRKKTFDFLVYCEESRFVFYVDDCLIGTYEHRLNPRSIDKLCIDGDIILHGVHLK